MRAASLANIDELTGEQLAEAKIQEMRKEAVAIIENATRKEVEAEMDEKIKEKIKKALKQSKLTLEEIAEVFDVTPEYIDQIKNELN